MGTTMSKLVLPADGIRSAKVIMESMKLHRHFRETDFSSRYADEVYSLWRDQGRQALSVHPGLVEVVRMATSSKILGEVFRCLPYLEPMIVFPEPIELHSPVPGEQIRLLGFFAHGRVDTRNGMVRKFKTGEDGGVRICSTHDPEGNRYAMLFVSEIIKDGKTFNFQWDRLSIDLNETLTLREHCDRLVREYGFDPGVPLGISDDLERRTQAHLTNWGDISGREKFLRGLLSVGLGVSMYLCSTVVDAQRLPRKAVAKHWTGSGKQPDVIDIAWNVGPLLSNQRKAATPTGAETGLPGRSQPPHQRCAHFKIVWTGKGKRWPKTALVAPYWVRQDLLDTIHTKTLREARGA